MNINRIVTYSLLAYINDHDKGIKDLNDIFLPLVKRALYRLNKRGISRGLLSDIKNEVDKSYSFDIPFPILRKIILKVASEANKDVANDFQFFHDGSFIMSKFIFADYEEVILKQQAEVDSLSNTYEQYLLANNIKPSSQPSIFEFLDKNRVTLSSFFSLGKQIIQEPSFFIQAKFVNAIKTEQSLYQIMRKVYLGSIITSYLELDLGEIRESNTEYLLDSSFIIHLLDLSSPESTHTCRKILEICNRLKFKVSLLDFTIDETEALLNRIGDSLNTTYLIKELDERSIYNACARKSLGKTDLIRMASNLGATLKKDYGIHIISHTSSFRNKAKNSDEYRQLKDRTNNPDGAWHDSTAIIYVQESRKKRVRNFYEANCWFVTDTKQDIAITRKKDGTLPEMIRPEELVNILWLTNPNVKGNEITDVGLTRLIAGTISDSLPNARVLKEFDQNIQKYCQGKIEPADCIRLGHMIANKTLTNLEGYNDKAKESPSRFVEELSQCAEKAKIEEQEIQQKGKELILRLKANYENKLREKETSLRESYDAEIKELELAHTAKTLESRNRELDTLKYALSEVENAYDKMNNSKTQLDSGAFIKTKKFFINLSIIYFALIIGEIILNLIFGWQIIEQWTYFLNLIPPFAGYVLFALTQRSASPIAIWESMIKSKKEKLYASSGFDVEYFSSLKSKIIALKNRIKEMS